MTLDEAYQWQRRAWCDYAQAVRTGDITRARTAESQFRAAWDRVKKYERKDRQRKAAVI